ncbi:head fiber protein, partial [Comamonas nitrativorans]
VNATGQAVVNVPWVDTNTTYNAATTGAAGLMSATDKTKLDGIEAEANKYTLPSASATVLGGIKLGHATVQTVAAAAPTATASRSYAVQANASGQAVVNVPWTNTTYSAATATAVGLVELATNAETQSGTDAARAVTPAALAAVALGQKQTWQDLTGSRAANTNYTNTTGRAIFVHVLTAHISNGSANLEVGGVLVSHESAAIGGGQNNNLRAVLTAVVPDGGTYKVSAGIWGGPYIESWVELR